MPAKESFLERARRELEQGRPWRAREILKSNIGTRDFDAEVFAAYGELLMLMGDPVEGGKFLFLAGSERPDHEPAIQTFLERHARSEATLRAQFPRRTRDLPVESFPDPVQRTLIGLATRPREDGMHTPRRSHAAPEKLDLGCIVAVSVVAVIVFALFCTAVGFVQVVRWIAGLMGL